MQDPEYRRMKEELLGGVIQPDEKIPPPYIVIITVECYADVDNIIKPILDVLQQSEVITDDRDVLTITAIKFPIKRGMPGKLKVSVSHLSERDNSRLQP